MCAHNGSKGRCARSCPGFVAKVGMSKPASDAAKNVKAVVAAAMPPRKEPETILGISRMPLYPEFCDFEQIFHRIQKGPWI
jgi:hypothetical protein